MFEKFRTACQRRLADRRAGRAGIVLLTLTALLLSFAVRAGSAGATVPTRAGSLKAALARQLDAAAVHTVTKPASTPAAPHVHHAAAPAASFAVHTEASTTDPSGPTTTTQDPTPTESPSASAPETQKPATQTPATETPATDQPGTSQDGTTDPSESYSLSAAAKDFLAGLDINLGSGPVTGTLKGTTLTVQIGAPALPLTLPVGNDAISFSGASLTIDESTGTLTLSASAGTADGASGTLSVSIAHADSTTLSGTDLSATVTLNGLPVLGTTVDLSGTLAYTDGAVSASLTGTLDQDTVVASNVLTVGAGSTITVSTKDGVTLDGTAIVGSGNAQFTVKLSGAFSNEKNWKFSVDDDTNAPSFTPVKGLTITPAFSGSIEDKDGTVSFDVAADQALSWTPADSVTLSVEHVEVSNEAPPSGVACPAGVKDGDVWVDVKGGLTDTAAGISADGEACVDPAAQAFKLTGTSTGTFGPSGLGFTLNDPTISVDGDLKAGTVSVSATADLAISDKPAFPITLSFASDGSFTASASVDLSQYNLGTGTGTLLLSSKEIKQYTNAHITDPIDLPAGVTVLLQYDPSSNNQVSQVFKALNLPVPNSVQAQATLSTSGFAISLNVGLGAGANGAPVLPHAPGGFQIYLDSLQLKLALTASSGSITIGGSALLQIPALYAGSSASSVQLTLSGSLTLTPDSVKIDAGFDLDAPDGTWHDAFGIPGLSIGELAARVGIEEQPEDAGIPLPTLSFTVNNVVLPAEWANAIGEVNGAAVSATLDLDVDNPILSFAISPGAGQTAALEPLRIANDFTAAAGQAPLPESTVDQLQIRYASLLFAPVGGKDATGTQVSPGASLVFDAVIGGRNVHVDGSIGLSPYPHLTAHVSVPSFGIGPVSFNGTTLAIDLEANPAAPKIDFDFSGGFTDWFTGIRFTGSVDLHASTSLLNAGITLHIAGGQPSYIAGDAGLTGSVYANSSGFGFNASGSAYAYVAGQYIGTVSFSYSSDYGSAFAQLQQLGSQIAYWFRYYYGEADTQVAAVLNQIGIGATQIASTLQSIYGDSQAAIYNALQQIGRGGQTVLDAISGFFNTGSYWIYSNPWYSVPLFVDDAGGSQAPGNGIVQWTWNGGHNQDWYVLPTDSGYAEIVNRNSGQCLSQVSWAGGQVVQEPCTGSTTQQWYLGVYPGQNLNYTGHTVTNRWSGLDLDVNGGSTSAGAAIDTWYGNGGWNQWFTFEPAIG